MRMEALDAVIKSMLLSALHWNKSVVSVMLNHLEKSVGVARILGWTVDPVSGTL